MHLFEPYWQAIREHRDVLLLNIKMAEGEEKLPAVAKALDLLERMKLVQYYEPMLAARLKQIAEALEGYTAGTGFAVTAEGHVLTNHHVIEEEGKNLVQLPGRKDPVPAKVLARDPQRDIALLKVEVPEGIELKPVHIGTTEVHRGTRVGAFGLPAEGAIGSGLKLTTGVISADPDQTEEGMALPAKDLREFLKKHLSDYEKLPAVEPSETRLEWDEIDRIVGPAVLLIRKAR